jgi:hypothetical protein
MISAIVEFAWRILHLSIRIISVLNRINLDGLFPSDAEEENMAFLFKF